MSETSDIVPKEEEEEEMKDADELVIGAEIKVSFDRIFLNRSYSTTKI